MAGEFVAVPDWFAWENHDCGLAIADIDGDGPLVFALDHHGVPSVGQWLRLG